MGLPVVPCVVVVELELVVRVVRLVLVDDELLLEELDELVELLDELVVDVVVDDPPSSGGLPSAVSLSSHRLSQSTSAG